MALLFMDGFDHLGSGNAPYTFGKWASGTSGGAITSVVRTGTHSSGHGNAGNMTTNAFAASGGVVVGFGFYTENPQSAADYLIRVLEGATFHIGVIVMPSGVLEVRRGDGTVLATGTTALALNSWHYLEFKAVIHDSADRMNCGSAAQRS